MFSSNTSAVSGDAVFVEDVFSAYLYTGNGSTGQSINNGIDLSTKGGLTWIKSRSAAGDNLVYDTARGIPKVLFTNGTNPSTTYTSGYDVTSFNTNGFSLGPNDYGANANGTTYTSWTFRKQPKFFDVVTYTGNGTSGRTIAHSLGSVPGCIIVKNTSNTADWAVYHRSLGSTKYITLNATDPADTASSFWNNTDPTSTNFTVGSGGHQVNWNGETYVAYIFAHDAGGFGLTGTDNVISCGSFTSNATVTLGYEPQWVMVKATSGTGDWMIADTMRGMAVGSSSIALYPNLSSAEGNDIGIFPTATGFTTSGYSGTTFIYIAIRRGPMKVPTDATKVFGTDTFGSTSPKPPDLHASFPVDFAFYRDKSSVYDWYAADRLRGAQGLSFNNTNAESAITAATFDYQNGWYNSSVVLSTYQSWMFRRAPSFFDEVCYTGNGTAGTTYTHNLGVAPELWIVKKRSAAGSWTVGSTSIANSEVLYLQATDAKTSNTAAWNSTYPSSTVLTVGNSGNTNGSGSTYVAYLFATCPGVSKVFSFTGNGSSQTINCGFTAGARFVMIKRTDSTGDWYVWDTARGIVSGNDPHLSLNTTSAEVTSNDTIDTDSTGFIVNQLSATNVNVSSATYIGIAIA